jgi:putative redox protein
MEMEIVFPGGKKVDALIGNDRIQTDQMPAAGGDGSAPAPFALFLASIGTCAGIYVLGFCQSRGISTDGIKIIQKMNHNPVTQLIDQIELEIQLPSDFPEQYKSAVIKSAQLCAVKKHLENPPDFNITTKTVDVENVFEEVTVETAY